MRRRMFLTGAAAAGAAIALPARAEAAQTDNGVLVLSVNEQRALQAALANVVRVSFLSAPYYRVDASRRIRRQLIDVNLAFDSTGFDALPVAVYLTEHGAGLAKALAEGWERRDEGT